MSAASLTVQGTSCRPRSCARCAELASTLLKFGAQTLPPAALTMSGTDA